MVAGGTRLRELQGWQDDPFGRFEQRYFSQGAATALVLATVTGGVIALSPFRRLSFELVVVVSGALATIVATRRLRQGAP